MFRDLKEYQEIAKIYTEKVSKPEDLEENRNTRGQELAAKRLANKPKTREEVGLPPKKKPSPFERKFGKERNEKRLIQSGLKKKLPTTAEIRAKDKAAGGTGMSNIPKKEGSAVIDGKKLNPDFGKKVDIKKEFPDKPKISKFTKQGKPRTKAQMMAAKRIADGKTISDVKAENQASMKARAKAKFEAFKKRREEKKAGMSEESEHEVNEAVGAAALKLGGMVLPKIPSALKAIGAGAATGGVLMQKIRRTKSKLNPDPNAGVDGEPEVGKVTTYKKNKRTGRYNRTTKRDKAGEESASMNKNDPAGDISNDLYKDTVRSDVGPVKKTKKGYSILKKRRERAYEKEMEKNSKQQRYNEILQGAKPIKNIGTKVIQQDHYEYDAYDLVLEYLLSTEQVATIEEANYVMTEMDANTIGSIVKEVKLSLQDK